MSENLERWGDAAPEWMRDAAASYEREGPSELELDRMLTHVQRTAAVQSSEGAPRRLLRLRLAGKLALGALALAWLALVLSRAPSARQRSAPAERDSTPMHAPIQAAPARPLQPPTAQGLEPAPEVRATTLATDASKPVLRRRDEVTVAPLDELTLLVRARRVLGRAPERAYALTEQHRESYRRGVLSEERELLAIEALVALEQRAAAEARAAQFARRFPRSVHARKLGLILRRVLP